MPPRSSADTIADVVWPGFTFAPDVVPVMVTTGLTASMHGDRDRSGLDDIALRVDARTLRSRSSIRGRALAGTVNANDSVRVSAAGSKARVAASCGCPVPAL